MGYLEILYVIQGNSRKSGYELRTGIRKLHDDIRRERGNGIPMTVLGLDFHGLSPDDIESVRIGNGSRFLRGHRSGISVISQSGGGKRQPKAGRGVGEDSSL
jgi:hypothetical protein